MARRHTTEDATADEGIGASVVDEDADGVELIAQRPQGCGYVEQDNP